MCKASTSAHFPQHPVIAGDLESTSRAHWVPNTDVYRTDDGLVIKVELAGMRREDLQITVDGSKLRISGQRPDGCRGPKFNFLAMEISYGSFETVLDIPSGYDLVQAKASYLNGFLRVDVPVMVVSPAKRTCVPINGT